MLQAGEHLGGHARNATPATRASTRQAVPRAIIVRVVATSGHASRSLSSNVSGRREFDYHSAAYAASTTHHPITHGPLHHYLSPLLKPASVALVGASERPGSVGRTVYENMLVGGYEGPLYAVNPGHRNVLGRPCFASLAAIEAPVDLAIIATSLFDLAPRDTA